MKAFAQAIKKISLENGVSPSHIMWGRVGEEICFLDAVNGDLFSLASGILKKCQYDNVAAGEIMGQTFGSPNVVAKELFAQKFPTKRDLVIKQQSKIPDSIFYKDLKEMLSQKYPGMEQEIDAYISQYGKQVYRSFGSMVMTEQRTIPGGKGKSQNSTCFINMPPRPTASVAS